MPTIAERIQGRINQIDADIARVQAQAIAQVAELRADKQALIRAAQALASVADAEAIIDAVRKIGGIL